MRGGSELDFNLYERHIETMKSMTGFGRDQATGKNVSLDISVKSVNGRYLDVKLSMPRIYTELENRIKKEVQKVIGRGNVEVYIHRRVDKAASRVVFDHKLGKAWLSGYRELLDALDLSGDVSADTLLAVPDLYSVEDNRNLEKAEVTLLFATLKNVLKQCGEERAREGLGLQKDLARHLETLGKLGGSIAKLRQKSEKAFAAKFQQKLKKIHDVQSFDESRLIQEVTILLEKSDITEELQRLELHILEVTKLLDLGKPVGKKLDFFCQELLREVNTMGSKSATVAITQKVVECKSVIEKFREQVQNIE